MLARRDQSLQASAQFGVGHGTLGTQTRQFAQQRLVHLRPVHGVAQAGCSLAPQVCRAALEHQDQLIGGAEQAVAQEARHLHRACRLLDLGAGRGRPGGHAAGVAAYQEIGQLAKGLVDLLAVQPVDAFEHLADLSRRVLGRRRPQPTLPGLAGGVGLSNGLAPAIQYTRLHFGADLDGGLGLQVDQRGGDQGANGAVVHDQQTVLVQPVPRKHQELIPVGAARNLVAQQAHEGAALVLAHPSEPQGFAGDLLVVEQGAAAAVERPQRGQFRGIDAQLVAEVAP